MHGHGILKFPDSRKYVGYSLHDQKSGLGTFTWPEPNKRQYVGYWLNDMEHGPAEYTSQDDNIKKYGIWKNGSC